MTSQPMQPMRASRASGLSGTPDVPGDKSTSHRALIFGALANGTTAITGLLKSDDVLATASALEAMGAPIERSDDTWTVSGRGVGGLREPTQPIDFGNTGTGVRLMMGVVAGHDMTATFVGDESLSRRPMGRVLDPLQEMGLGIGEDRNQLPLTLHGTTDLVPITYELPVASAQVKSAVLIAGLHAPGETTVIEPTPTRDHTERMLTHFGATVRVVPDDGGRAITVTGHAELTAADVAVPVDPSSAAFPVAAALIVPGSEITVTGVMLNPTRAGLYAVLKDRMGADITFANRRTEGGEDVADLVVRSSALKGCDVPQDIAPSMIDEYPMLAVLAAFAEGTTRMHGLAELRVKECDRLAVTAAGLQANGVRIEIEGDTLIVHGQGPDGVRGGGTVETELDHRIAMAFLVMGLASQDAVTVDDIRMIATSFPNFVPMMTGLGASLEAL